MDSVANTPQLKLEGRSGCGLEIFAEDSEYFVRKLSSDPQYNARLEKQMQKQRDFLDGMSDLKGFEVPEIADHGLDVGTNIFWFSMRYVSGIKATEFLSKADTSTLQELGSVFLNYFETLQKESVLSPPPLEAINNKINGLEKNLLSNSKLNSRISNRLLEYLRLTIPKEHLYLGKCHGDFTLSNVLFGKDSIYLLDFLDSFIESPMIDIVKLRQDTKFGWTIIIDKKLEAFKIGRTEIAMKFLDEVIWEYIHSDYGRRLWYNYLEVFNLARVLPYLDDPKEIDFVQNAISELVN